MMWILFLLFVACLADEFSVGNGRMYPGLNLEEIEREFREQDRDIHRPCAAYDLLCIRRYLAQHSNCEPTQGPVPDPLYRTQTNLYIPNYNITVIENSLEISGLGGTVREFYVNRKADLTVLAVDFTNVTIGSKRITFKYHRRGQEPIITSTPFDMGIYPSFTTTTVFKGVDHLVLEDSETVLFFNAAPIITPGIDAGISSEDPTIPARFAELLANLPTALQEVYLNASPFFASMFIQYTLCDFHLFVN